MISRDSPPRPPKASETPGSFSLAFGRAWISDSDTLEPEDLAERSDRARLVPVVRAGQIGRFSHTREPVTRWAEPERAEAVSKGTLPFFRLAVRRVSSARNARTLVATVLPPGIATGPSVYTSAEPASMFRMLTVCALLNSYVCDWEMRRIANTTINACSLHQLHIPEPAGKVRRALYEAALRRLIVQPGFAGPMDLVGFGAPDRAAGTRAACFDAWMQAAAAMAFGLDRGDLLTVLAGFDIGDVERDAILFKYDQGEGYWFETLHTYSAG